MSVISTDTSLIRYNGFTFNSSAQATVASEPVKDDANRTVIYRKVTITVRAVIADDTSTDGSLENIRNKLSEAGQALTFTNQGFGDDLQINTAGGQKDVMWGPLPQVVNWKPIGSLRACEIEWAVVVHLSPCEQKDRGLMAFNFSVDYAIDDRGMTTRTTTGYLQIALTRRGKKAPDTADSYRHLIAPTIPTSYKRSQSFTLSADKSRLDFSVVDTQINSPNPYPPGVVNIDAKHRVKWGRKNIVTLQNSISVSVETAADAPPETAVATFLGIIRSRIGAAQSVIAKNEIWLDSVSMEEDLFSRKASFSVDYRILRCLSEILAVSGLWSPLGTDWNLWRQSMNVAYHERGYSQLRFTPESDVIVDLCGAPPSQLSNPESRPNESQGVQFALGLRNEVPPAESSWLGYDMKMKIIKEQPVVRQRILQLQEQEPSPEEPNSNKLPNFGSADGIDDVVQKTGRGSYMFLLEGKAMRAGHPIPRPAVARVGNQQAIEIDSEFKHGAVDNHLGVPIYAASFQTLYTAPNSPGEVKTRPNPKECITEDGDIQ